MVHGVYKVKSLGYSVKSADFAERNLANPIPAWVMKIARCELTWLLTATV